MSFKTSTYLNLSYIGTDADRISNLIIEKLQDDLKTKEDTINQLLQELSSARKGELEKIIKIKSYHI